MVEALKSGHHLLRGDRVAARRGPLREDPTGQKGDRNPQARVMVLEQSIS